MAPNLTLTPELQAAEGDLAPITPTTGAPTGTAQATPAAPPAAGAAALGSTDMDAANAALQMRTAAPPPFVPAPGSFGAKLMTAAGQLGIPMKPDGKPEPGGWAKSLVGAAQHVMSDLGDVPSDKAPVGAGIAAGISKTLANRNARLTQQRELQDKEAQQQHENERQDRRDSIEEQRFKLDMTEANLRMINEQRLAHQAEVAPMIEQGKKTISMLTNPNSPHQAPVAGRDLTYAQIQQGVIDGKWNLHDFTPFPTGQNFKEGEEPTTTYTLVGAQQPVKLNADNPDDKSTIDFINKNHGADKPITSGQDFTFAQFNQVYQNASDVAAATASRNKTLRDNDVATDEQIKKLEPALLGKNPMWIKAIADAKGDPVVAYAKISQNPDMIKQFPNLAADVRTDYPQFDKLSEMREAQKEKLAEKAAEDAHNISGVPMTDEMQANINSLPADKKSVLLGFAPKDTVLQATLYSLAQNDGTLDLDKIFPNRNYKGSQAATLQQAVGIIKQLNPQFSEQNYRAMSKEIASMLPGTKKGDAIEQYNNVLQHAAELQDTMLAVGSNRPAKFYNTDLNKMEKEGWGTDPATIAAALEPLKGEFELLMSGGYKPSEEMQAAYKTIIDPTSTPGMMGAAMKKMAATGAIRLQNMDEGYMRLAGKHIPNLLAPEALAAAKHLGLETADPATWSRLTSLNSGGTQFTPGIPAENKPAALQPPTPQSHVFDKGAWMAKHPGQDVGPIAKAAQDAGYQVR